ncbi:MAG: MATE family efflux transporter [Lachnospiraceae bacterium]|nr:MATE family efflux transporter [Lachnospiraceae bacterium]
MSQAIGKKRSSTIDMTKGNPTSLLLSFMLPLLIGNIFQQLYNTVDTMVVGKFVSAEALAAVGSTGSITNLFLCLCNGLAAGVGIIISQYFGAKNMDNMRRAIINSVYIMSFIGIIIGLLGVTFTRPVLILMNTPENILDSATIYMQISCAGVLATSVYNGFSAILRGLGDSKTPLFCLIISSFLNISLDLIFVLVFHLGVAGTSMATVIAQFVSALLTILYTLWKNPIFKFAKKDMRFDRDIAINCFRLGIPMALQSSLTSLSFVILQSAINSFGSVIVSTWTTTSRIETLMNQPLRSLGNSLSTYAGQNVGAKEFERTREGCKKGFIMMMIFTVAMIPVMWLFGEFFIGLFVSGKELEIIATGATALKILSIFHIPLGIIYVYRGVLNGAGDAKFSLISGLAEMAGRILFPGPLSMIPAIGFWGLWIGTGLTWSLVALTNYLRYRAGKWSREENKVLASTASETP